MDRLNHLTRNLAWVFVVGAMVGSFPAMAPAAISIDLVTVGDPGNVGELSGRADLGTERLCGAVPYIYQIGTYEVTNAQYRAFLNSVARYGDSYVLYNYDSSCGSMQPHDHQGIARTGAGMVGDPYVYVSRDGDPNWETRPANYVSWYSTLRFINWLQNGQPTSEAGIGVTETGTYAIGDPSTVVDKYGNSSIQYPVTIPDHASLTTPTWVLPTEDEWYKGAYYRGGGTAAGYWDYATQSDTLPDNNPPSEDTGNSANYGLVDDDPNTPFYAVGPPYYMTDAGAYSLSESAYGTYDQDGNVFEVLESLSPYLDGEQGVRGSSWAHGQFALPAFTRAGGVAQDVGSLDLGFRVAVVPEPCTFLLVGASAVVWVGRRKPG